MTTDDIATIKRLARRSRDDPAGVPLEPITEVLDHENDSVREQATTALYEVSKAEPERLLETIPRLVELLDSDRATIRSKVTRTMAIVGAGRPDVLTPYTDVCIGALEDDSALVQKGAVEVLRHVVTEEPASVTASVPRLVPLFDSGSESIRHHAIAVLKEIAINEPDSIELSAVVEPLLEVLEDPYEYPSDIVYDPKTAPGMVDPADQIRGYQTLVQDDQGRSENVRARERAAATMSILSATDPEMIIDVLDGHFPRLFSLVDDRDPHIRGPIVEVLAHVAGEDPEAVRPVEEKLIDTLEDQVVVGRNAVWALGFIGSDRSLEALRSVVDDDDIAIAVRTTAENVLDELDDLES